MKWVVVLALSLTACTQGDPTRDGGNDRCAVVNHGPSLAYFPCLKRLPEWRLHHAKVIAVVGEVRNGYTIGYWVVTE